MLDRTAIDQIASELAEADRTRELIPRITKRFPDATVEDSYEIQGVWRDQQIVAGRCLVGRKIGLTSKAMQAATEITEPDYGVMFDDTVYENGSIIDYNRFLNVRIEVELAFLLKAPSRAHTAQFSTYCEQPNMLFPHSRSSTRTSSLKAAPSLTQSPIMPPTAAW
ncbi:MAG: hypothetical protein ACTHWJ_02840 [Flaviflexus sp.]|uniref:hypothetical protein n=1 Tax=Flaviflexus sp. TaxID=1969482 RepID=UPI003F9001B6